MRFLSLEVKDYGVFDGLHSFHFVPQSAHLTAPERHITLVRGHNGAGKSTLFSAFGLAVHGALTLGERVSRGEYNDFLLGRMHRDAEGTASKETWLRLKFEYVESGRTLPFTVERKWTRNGSVVVEQLQVLRDNAVPNEVAPEDYPSFLADMVPLGLAPVCFFDAEKLDALSTVGGNEAQLAGVMRRLLGLDLVERLREDLDFYTMKQGGREVEPLRKEVFDKQQELAQARASVAQVQEELESLEAQAAATQDSLAGAERRLSLAGGNYAERRPQLQARHATVAREIEERQKELREACEGLLPFALAPALCRKVSDRLHNEVQAAQMAAFGQMWQSRVEQLRGQMEKDKFWGELEISPEMRRKLTKKVNKALKQSDLPAQPEKPLHPLSDIERDKTQEWIRQAMGEVRTQIAASTKILRALQEEERQISAELNRAPEEDALAPLHAEIEQLQTQLSDLVRQQGEKSGELSKLQYLRDESERIYNKAVETFTKAQKAAQKLVLAERSKSVLRVYKDALTRQQLARLEERTTAHFNRLCQKERLLSSIAIDPERFTLSAHDAQGRALGLHDFSAGERQLYSLSLLWALREISGRVLPLLIDTPLGRLDEAHRDRLIEEYFPNVSKQVLLFTTTAELDSTLLAQLEPRLSGHYHLQFDPHKEQTNVEAVPVGVQRPLQNGAGRVGHTNGHNGHKPEPSLTLTALGRNA